MKALDPWAIDDALRALAFSDERQKMRGVYMLAAYDTEGRRPCRVFGASTSPHEVWIMDAEGRRLIDHIDYTAEFGTARLSGYQVLEADDLALEADLQRMKDRQAAREGEGA